MMSVFVPGGMHHQQHHRQLEEVGLAFFLVSSVLQTRIPAFSDCDFRLLPITRWAV
jgi:hypothetical protein